MSAVTRGNGAALRENTVLPGEHVSESVFFGYPKHFGGFKERHTTAEADLRVPVGDHVSSFRLAGRLSEEQRPSNQPGASESICDARKPQS
jgi:hypothetical protein